MIIRAIKLRIATADGGYGFEFAFDRNLTVIRGRNSAGKSTLVNTLLYSLGMEELVGGRDERVLPYAVREYFFHDNQRVQVAASEVLIEIENRTSEVITLRRSIKHENRQSKLIEVFLGDCLTGSSQLVSPTPTYIHDAGGAQKNEGLHKYLEKFLQLELPTVPTSSGGETKLYLQTIFAGLAVEQKRGWTDYIASIPFYGIREARTKVVEFVLGLSVFAADALRNRLNAESVEINEAWQKLVGDLVRTTNSEGLLVQGLPPKPDPLFGEQPLQLVKREGVGETLLADYVSKLRQEHRELDVQADSYHEASSDRAVAELEVATEQLREISYLHEQSVNNATLQRASEKEYEQLLAETREDLERNKTAQKLRGLGADYSIDLASDRCPTCHQNLTDTLLGDAVSGPVMGLEENISYLKSQCQMLERQIAGARENARNAESAVKELGRKLASKRDHLAALRGDMSSGAVQSRAIVRRQVQIEVEVEALEGFERLLPPAHYTLIELAARTKANQAKRQSLSKERYSQADARTIGVFQRHFRANAGSFGYESANIEEIQINQDTLTPVLEQIELREISKKVTDIKADSSASDFVRLIWSYLLALYQTSSEPTVQGNHPGILLLDEPGQHSMRVESQHSLLQHLAGQLQLQSIVAASFDESQSVFQEATANVKFKLIEWDEKLIRPL